MLVKYVSSLPLNIWECEYTCQNICQQTIIFYFILVRTVFGDQSYCHTRNSRWNRNPCNWKNFCVIWQRTSCDVYISLTHVFTMFLTFILIYGDGILNWQLPKLSWNGLFFWNGLNKSSDYLLFLKQIIKAP